MHDFLEPHCAMKGGLGEDIVHISGKCVNAWSVVEGSEEWVYIDLEDWVRGRVSHFDAVEKGCGGSESSGYALVD